MGRSARLSAPLPFSIFLYDPVGPEGKYALFAAIDSDNPTLALDHVILFEALALHVLYAHSAECVEGVHFALPGRFHFRAQKLTDKIGVFADFGVKIDFDNLGRILTLSCGAAG